MKIKRINEIEGVQFSGGVSFRAVLESDNMGFALMKTVIPSGKPNKWHYPHHKEACYCIKGKGILKNLITSHEYLITPDVVYVLEKDEPHTFEAIEDVVLISVFNPPLKGNETHDKDGKYAI